VNSKNLTDHARRHLARVKALDCSCCGAPGPTSAHHIVQGQHYTTVALCHECHQGPHGWHGDRAYWRIRKLDELAALNITIAALS
jgi:hypothetical protein